MWTNSFSLSKARLAEQLKEGRRFAAGNHQAVDVVELLWLAHQYDFGAQLFQASAVGIEIAL